MPTIGQLRCLVEVQKPGQVKQDDYGDTENAWATIATVWAAIEPLSGNERWSAQQVGAEVSHKITVRWMRVIDSKMRIVYQSRVFNFQSVRDPDERHRWLEIMATEQV
jgi:SPP1 family predicted phage head-tail adaptor